MNRGIKSSLIALVAMGSFVTAAWAYERQVSNRNTPVDDGVGFGGVIESGQGVSGCDGDVVYSGGSLSGYYYRPFPGYRDYDDIHLEAGPRGQLISYTVDVFGSNVTGSDAGSPYDVEVSLWTAAGGDPATGLPDTLIDSCIFLAVPPGARFRLQCKPAPGINLPDGVWMGVEFSKNNCGWLIANNPIDCPVTGPNGYSEDVFCEEDLFLGGFGCYVFSPGGCPSGAPQASFCMNNPAAGAPQRRGVGIVCEGLPWSCCDTVTNICTNDYECACLLSSPTTVAKEGVLCNNLNPPCSEGGACCNTVTGVCIASFESECTGYLEVFTAGASCSSVVCDVPDNVPTVTQWGMIALTAILLVGLTIKFGRRRTVTA